MNLKMGSKILTNSISACPFYFSLFRMIQYLENFCWENILFFCSVALLFIVLNPSVISPHPQHSLSKAAFWNCAIAESDSWLFSEFQPSWQSFWIFRVCLASQFFNTPQYTSKCRQIMKELIFFRIKSKTSKDVDNKQKILLRYK